MNFHNLLTYLGILFLFYSCNSTKSGENNSSKKKSPNILFIAIDDLNDWTSKMHGNKQAITPNMDNLADRGILFTNAHTPMAVCMASRSAMLSGLHPTTSGWYLIGSDMHNIEKSYEGVMKNNKMMPHYFKENGYRTYGAGKIFHSGATDFSFLMDSLWNDYLPEYKNLVNITDKFYKDAGGYTATSFYPFPKGGSQLTNFYGEELKGGNSLCGGPLDVEDIPDGKMYDELIADYAINKLNEKHESPFFLAVGFNRPHVPYTAPRKYFDLYDKENISVPEVPIDEMSDVPLMGKAIAYRYGVPEMGDYKAVQGLGDNYRKDLVHSYLACVSLVDDQLGRVMKALDNSEYAENTIIVLWSDHGQSLGEKMNWRKMSLWEESTRVPMCIVVPDSKLKGETCSKPVSLIDVYPTLVELCGLPKVERLDGRSINRLIEKPKSDWPYAVLSNWRYKNYAVRTQDYRYILYRDGSEEYYNHITDPGEHINQINNHKYKKNIIEAKKQIPKNPAIPMGMEKWEGDELTALINEWKTKDSIPSWLR